jgi:hypothetical protein
MTPVQNLKPAIKLTKFKTNDFADDVNIPEVSSREDKKRFVTF